MDWLNDDDDEKCVLMHLVNVLCVEVHSFHSWKFFFWWYVYLNKFWLLSFYTSLFVNYKKSKIFFYTFTFILCGIHIVPDGPIMHKIWFF